MDRLEHDEVGRLYRQHNAGGALTDPEWLAIRAYIDWYCRRSIRDAAGRYRIPEHTWEELKDEVGTNVFAKFFKRSLAEADNVQAMLRVVITREIITALRKVRGVLTSQTDGTEGNRPGPKMREARGGDDFNMVRGRLEPFRFPDQHLVREMLLAHLLMTGDYPQPRALRSVVPQRELTACFNAAVFDINSALCCALGGEGA